MSTIYQDVSKTLPRSFQASVFVVSFGGPSLDLWRKPAPSDIHPNGWQYLTYIIRVAGYMRYAPLLIVPSSIFTNFALYDYASDILFYHDFVRGHLRPIPGVQALRFCLFPPHAPSPTHQSFPLVRSPILTNSCSTTISIYAGETWIPNRSGGKVWPAVTSVEFAPQWSDRVSALVFLDNIR